MKDFYDSDEWLEHGEEMEDLIECGDFDTEDIMDCLENYTRLKKQYDDKQPDWFKIVMSLNFNGDFKEANKIYTEARKHEIHPHEF